LHKLEVSSLGIFDESRSWSRRLRSRVHHWYVEYFHCSWHLNWFAQNLPLYRIQPAVGHSWFRQKYLLTKKMYFMTCICWKWLEKLATTCCICYQSIGLLAFEKFFLAYFALLKSHLSTKYWEKSMARKKTFSWFYCSCLSKPRAAKNLTKCFNCFCFSIRV